MKTDSDPMGWRMAGLTVALAVALTVGAWLYHKETYCDPTHPTCLKIGSKPSTHGDDSHAPGSAH